MSAKSRVRVTDRMRLDALAAEVSTTRAVGTKQRRAFNALTIRVMVWQEGFTVHLYRRGKELGLSGEPRGSIEDALRDTLDIAFRGRL